MFGAAPPALTSFIVASNSLPSLFFSPGCISGAGPCSCHSVNPLDRSSIKGRPASRDAPAPSRNTTSPTIQFVPISRVENADSQLEPSLGRKCCTEGRFAASSAWILVLVDHSHIHIEAARITLDSPDGDLRLSRFHYPAPFRERLWRYSCERILSFKASLLGPSRFLRIERLRDIAPYVRLSLSRRTLLHLFLLRLPSHIAIHSVGGRDTTLSDGAAPKGPT